MTRAPTVGIGLPVHNGAAFLEGTVASLLGQTYEDIELVISDNASDDGTEEIGRAAAASDPRVRYVRSRTNEGAARNFNRCFELTDGRFFKWAAVDDRCEPTYLARCVERLEDDPAIAWAHTAMRFVGPDGAEVRVRTADDEGVMSYTRSPERAGEAADAVPSRLDERPDRRMRAVLLETHGQGNWDVFGLVRRSVMAATRLQQSVYGADKVFVCELALAGRYAEVDEPLFVGRLHPEGSGALATAEEQQAWIDPARVARAARARLLAAYADAVRRAPLNGSERARCAAVLGSYLTQVDKWRAVARAQLRGSGTGGGYLPFIRPGEDG